MIFPGIVCPYVCVSLCLSLSVQSPEKSHWNRKFCQTKMSDVTQEWQIYNQSQTAAAATVVLGKEEQSYVLSQCKKLKYQVLTPWIDDKISCLSSIIILITLSIQRSKEGWPSSLRRCSHLQSLRGVQVIIHTGIFLIFCVFQKFPNFQGKLPLWAKLGDRGTFSTLK